MPKEWFVAHQTLQVLFVWRNFIKQRVVEKHENNQSNTGRYPKHSEKDIFWNFLDFFMIVLLISPTLKPLKCG